MAKQNKKTNDSLDSFKLWAEKDPYPKHYSSPTAGQGKRFLAVRGWTMTAKDGVLGFLSDVWAAVKAILRKIL